MATSSARLDELKKKFDESPRRYFAPLANEYRKLGDLTQAIALCRAHLPNQPGHISGHIVLAQALYEARELGESRGIFEAALDLDPENLIALRFLGDIAREQGEPLQARGWYERVLDADPRNDEIAALLKALEAEAAPANSAAAASAPSFSYEAPEASLPAETTPHDFAPTAIDEPFPFVHTTVGSGEPAPAGSFFGEDEAAPTIVAGELEAAPEASLDDWFAAPAASEASPHDGFATTSADVSASDHAPSAGRGSIDFAQSDAHAADELEESFFPDLSSATPPGSPVIAGAPTPIDVSALTPPFLTAQPESASGIPTPAFLQSIADEASASQSPSAEPHAAEPGEYEFDVTELPAGVQASFASSDHELAEAEIDAASDVPVEDSPTPAIASFASFAGLESLDSLDEDTHEAPVAAFERVTDEPVAAASASIEGFEAGEFSSEAAQTIASGLSDDLEVEYGEFVAPAVDEIPFIASSISVPIDEPDAYAAGAPELSAHEPFPMEDQHRADDYSSSAMPSGEAAQSWNEVRAPAIDATPVDGFAALPTADDAASPAESTVVSAAESMAESPTFAAAAASGPEEVAEVGASINGEVDTAAGTGTPFVTETMAELYLQQGFADEALAIYRQLLAQQPGDASLAHRVATLERGGHSTVVDGVAPRDASDRVGQSVRSFFAHFARRQPRRRRFSAPRDDDAEGNEPHGLGGQQSFAAGAAGREETGPFAGVATREEALTVPDERMAGSEGTATLAQLFQTGQVSASDDRAASALASAFRTDGNADSGRSGDGQLSLEHLFRDVPAHSSGAVTLDEFYEGSSPTEASAGSGGAPEEPDADIEQFTAWLEGLKKK